MTDLDITNDLRVQGDTEFSGSLSIGATTTISTNITAPIDIALTQVATTTSANPAPMGHYCNTGVDLFILDYIIDFRTANGLWGQKVTVGTTTCSGVIVDNACISGGLSLVATATDSLVTSSYFGSGQTMVMNTGNVDAPLEFPTATSTQGSFYNDGVVVGSSRYATTSPFLLKNSDCFVVHGDQDQATSSSSYVEAGAFTTFVGSFKLESRIR